MREIGAYVSRGEDKVEACCGNHGNKQVNRKLGATSSEAGQIGRSATLPRAALQRQGAGQRMLTLLSGPAFLAVTPATVTLAVTCRENGKKQGRAAESNQAEDVHDRVGRKSSRGRFSCATFHIFLSCQMLPALIVSCCILFYKHN